MNQKSEQMQYIYNNQGNQQKQTDIKNVNSQLNMHNSLNDQVSKLTNREIFMQDGTNYITQNQQKHKIFEILNQNQEIKNTSFIREFTSQISNTPQLDSSNQKNCDCLNKLDAQNMNNTPQLTYNNQKNKNYYQNQDSMTKQQNYDQKNESQSINQRKNYNTIQKQNQEQEQKPITSVYDKLVQQKGVFQEVILDQNYNSTQQQNIEQSIIISECNLMELRKREGQTIKILEKNLGIQKQENVQQFPLIQSKQIEKIKSNSINQPQYSIQQTEKQELKNTEKLQQQCDISNEKIEVTNLDDEKINIEEPVKVNNYVTTQSQLKGEKQLQQINQIIQPSQSCSTLEFEVLKKINQVRNNRVEGIKINFFRAIERLELSDCITDLGADKQIVQLIITQFPYLRRVRGDGNCLFSSLLFPYLELIYVNDLFDNVLNQFVAHEIYWNKDIIIDRTIILPLIKKIFQELKRISKKCNNDMMMFSEVILHCINQVNGFYDILIIFMRSTIIQSYKLYHKQGEYQYFLDEKTSEEFLERNSCFEVEGDFLSIQFFSEISQLKVKLINFSDKNPISSMQTLEPKINKLRKEQNNFITLKYNEGHYDILYSRMLKQIQIKEEVRKLPQIEFTALY